MLNTGKKQEVPYILFMFNKIFPTMQLKEGIFVAKTNKAFTETLF